MDNKKVITILGFQITILGGLAGIIEALGLTIGFCFWMMVIGVLVTATAFISGDTDPTP
jgi:hypothetical protein